MKYLLLLGLIAVIWWSWSKRKAADASPPSPPRGNEKMVCCAHCGIYLPESDSVADGAATYCSEAHRALGRSAGR